MNWTKFVLGSILCAHSFLGNNSFSQEHVTGGQKKTAEALALDEAKVARESAEKRALELELELDRLRKDYDKLRSRYAELYLDSHAAVEKLRDMELRAAHLLQNKASAVSATGETEAMEALSITLGRQVAVKDALLEYEKYMSTLMDVLQPSAAVKSELESKVSDLKKAVEASLKPLSIVARRGSGGLDAGTCGILALREELQLVIIDRGLLSGVRPGKRWHLTGAGGKVVARLQTVDSRPDISAAVLTDGGMDQLSVGGILSSD